jgi:excisionase family DNA binding protein
VCDNVNGKENLVMAIASAPDPGEELNDLRLYRVKDAMRLLNLSRTVIYEQLRANRLRSIRQGRARLITADAIRDYIALLESEAEEMER